MTAVVVRRTSTADVPILARLDAACFDVPWDERSFMTLLTGELTLGWSLHRHDDVLAYVIARVVAGEAEILRMGVRPDVRRQSLGATVLHAVLDDIGPRVPHGLHLEVRAANAPARRLYARHGFAETGTRPGYYAAPPDDAILMRWRPVRLTDELS